ncbi:hypothetical protein B0F88_10388 [Methylobacter tundripaludum]|uniref:Uncharacterized protein n=1 Tax=Methylobacter tundripaludum TaxID=173365 RepID=A0A2S6H590_9GAMM|nr:hypothetical protein [Methylobacter tundripaludum]PPK72655.1 hypothetical protein B0F88_10388 [Methylobacter tundripaludum]
MRNETQQQHCSATQLLNKYIDTYKRETGVTDGTFATTVREHYERTHLPQSRAIEWSQAPDAYARMTRDAAQLNRWLGDNILKPLSIDLLGSVIAAFPPDLRFRLQIELAAWQGMVTFPMPSGYPSDDGVFLGSVAKEVGDVLIAGATLLEDGVIDSRDKDKAPEFMLQVDEAIAVLFAMKAHVSRAVGQPPVVGVDLRAVD